MDRPLAGEGLRGASAEDSSVDALPIFGVGREEDRAAVDRGEEPI